MAAFGLVLAILLLLVLRQPLTALLLVGIAYIHLVWGQGRLDYIIEDMWWALNTEALIAVPLFMLCGAVMAKGSSARRLVRIIRIATATTRGGLGVATLVSCAVFAAISGSSVVTMIAVGSVLLPALKEAGYSDRFSLGSVLAGGTLGILIPPSIPLILYGLVTDTSVVELFTAGLLPALVILALFCGYAIWANQDRPAATALDWAQLGRAVRNGLWALLFPIILLGGIYSGFYTPTESAAVALAYALFIEFAVYRDMRFQDYVDVVMDTAKLAGALFPLVAAALSLNLLLVEHRIPDQLVALASAQIGSSLTFLVIANLVLLLAGALMTASEAIVVLAPLLTPIAVAFGFHPVHFGIIMIINLEIGYLTPPVGLNLWVAMVNFAASFKTLIRSVLPFILLLAIGLAIVAAIPQLSLWMLPS